MWSLVVVVDHPLRDGWVRQAASIIVSPVLEPRAFLASEVSGEPWLLAVEVGHEPKAVSDVERADARRRNTDRPNGVGFSFQVILNKIEPSVFNRCINLFTKDDWRSQGPYKMEPIRP